ncbi:MAG: reverse transcriptase/maturase family protein [Treponema sp.]|nr:reverse transcriptase/maturase family protein [Treponema sp.]
MGKLYERICEFENLYEAAIKAARGKRYKNSVLRFFNEGLEDNLFQIQQELMDKTYRLGEFRKFIVYEPKKREIAALPFRDRIVQIALCNIIEPLFDTRYIFDTYACREGKGTHAAARRLSYFIGKPDARLYLKCDIHKYFHSIDIERLMDVIKKRYIPDDDDVMWLIDLILRADYQGAGIKIGNRFSQLAANAFLAELDFQLKVRLQVPYYIRYMDDFIVLGNSKARLKAILKIAEAFVEGRLGLKLNDKTRIDSVRNGIDFVGFRVFPRNKIIKKGSMNRTAGVFRAWRNGKMTDEKYLASIGSRCGHAVGTASYQFYNKILLKSLQVALSPDRIGGGGGKRRTLIPF